MPDEHILLAACAQVPHLGATVCGPRHCLQAIGPHGHTQYTVCVTPHGAWVLQLLHDR